MASVAIPTSGEPIKNASVLRLETFEETRARYTGNTLHEQTLSGTPTTAPLSASTNAPPRPIQR
jgi:hypothetical protein